MRDEIQDIDTTLVQYNPHRWPNPPTNGTHEAEVLNLRGEVNPSFLVSLGAIPECMWHSRDNKGPGGYGRSCIWAAIEGGPTHSRSTRSRAANPGAASSYHSCAAHQTSKSQQPKGQDSTRRVYRSSEPCKADLQHHSSQGCQALFSQRPSE